MLNSLLRLLGMDAGDVSSVAGSSWVAARPVAPALFWTLAAAGLALALFNLWPRVAMAPRLRAMTVLLRLAMVGILLLIVVQVEWHLRLRMNERQRWQVLVDDSGSMDVHDIGGRSRYEAALADLESLRKAAGATVEIQARSLSGAPLGDAPGQGSTRIEAGLRTTLAGIAPRRVILMSDGRDSEGRDLTGLGRELKARGTHLSVRFIGTDTPPPQDRGLFAEPERRVLRLGEELVVRGAIHGQGKAEGGAQVKLSENGKEVLKTTISADRLSRFSISYRPARAGDFLYAISLAGGDAASADDAVAFQVKVLENKIKVFLMEGYPGFEFKLLKAALEVDPLLELTTLCHLPGGGVYVQGKPAHRNPEKGLIDSPMELFKYDVLIMCDLPRSLFRAGGDTAESRLRHIVDFVTERGGGLVVFGGQDVFRAGRYETSCLAEILPFDLGTKFGKDPQFDGLFFASVPQAALDHPILRLLPDPAQNRERLLSLRELDGCNNVGAFRPIATPLMTRKMKVKDGTGKDVERELPVMACVSAGEGKVVASSADTLWRWQLQPDLDDPPLQMLLANMVRYLAPSPQKPDTPAASLAGGALQVGQEIVLCTTLKDPGFAPIRNAELVVTVKRPDGVSWRIYPRDLPEQPGRYEYRVKLELPGLYTVRTQYGGKIEETSWIAGAFLGEYADLSADRKGMRALAEAADGDVSDGPGRWDALDTKPAVREELRDVQVWNSPLLMALLFILVCADCYLRKRSGLA